MARDSAAVFVGLAGLLLAAAAVATASPPTPAVATASPPTAAGATAGPSSRPKPAGPTIAVPHTLTTELTTAGCAPTRATVPAGPVTLTVTNTDAAGSSELAVGDGSAQLGEVEDVSPGSQGSLSLVLQEGTYTVSCQSETLDAAKETVTVTPAVTRVLTPAEALTHQLLLRAGTEYDQFVRSEAAALQSTTKTFDDAIRADDASAAKTDYAQARVHYERIEPVAESFGQLDALIDERVDDVPKDREWSGFHRLEHDLWVAEDISKDAPVAGELDLAVANLGLLVDRETDQPAQLADGAASLLAEIGTTKITGEEERYSHLDGLDLSANVDGATEAINDLLPALGRIDQQLAGTVTRRFATMRAATANLPTDWSTATSQLKAAVSAAVDAAAEPLAEVAQDVAGA